MEESGHTPHLEQPAVTAAAISAFARGQPVGGSSDAADVVSAAARWDQATEQATKLGAAAGAAASELASKAAGLVREKFDGN